MVFLYSYHWALLLILIATSCFIIHNTVKLYFSYILANEIEFSCFRWFWYYISKHVWVTHICLNRITNEIGCWGGLNSNQTSNWISDRCFPVGYGRDNFVCWNFSWCCRCNLTCRFCLSAKYNYQGKSFTCKFLHGLLKQKLRYSKSKTNQVVYKAHEWVKAEWPKQTT